jgi:DNA topoisomerase IB
MRLRRVDCAGAGIRRTRRGRGFSYIDASGKRVTDTETLDRIKALVIPPAWEDVWVCSVPNGHIQATGTDAAGRRQYLYHEAWRVARDREKHDRMTTFARKLPAAREQMREDLQRAKPDKRRVLAGAARLLDLGFFRIGTEEYADSNGSYGLATLLREDVTVSRDGSVAFDYVAKGGVRREVSLDEPGLHRLIATLKRRNDDDPELLAYKTSKGWHDVKSTDINAYLAEVMGEDFTAKDFRTWHATVLCAVGLAVSTNAPPSESARKRAVARAVKETAERLGNTPAVCRSSYIDPRVVDRYNDGRTIRAALDKLGADSGDGELASQGPAEQAVLRLITR